MFEYIAKTATQRGTCVKLYTGLSFRIYWILMIHYSPSNRDKLPPPVTHTEMHALSGIYFRLYGALSPRQRQRTCFSALNDPWILPPHHTHIQRNQASKQRNSMAALGHARREDNVNVPRWGSSRGCWRQGEVKVRRQLARIGSLLICGSWRLNLSSK